MTLNSFFEILSDLLQTGNLNLPGKEQTGLNYAEAAALACSLFEREAYKRLGTIPASFYTKFYRMLVFTIGVQSNTLPLARLDPKSKLVLQRNLDAAASYIPEEGLIIAHISKILLV